MIELCFILFLSAGFLFCVLSLVCGLVMAYFDKRAARILKKADAKTGKYFFIFYDCKRVSCHKTNAYNFRGTIYIYSKQCITLKKK